MLNIKKLYTFIRSRILDEYYRLGCAFGPLLNLGLNLHLPAKINYPDGSYGLVR